MRDAIVDERGQNSVTKKNIEDRLNAVIVDVLGVSPKEICGEASFVDDRFPDDSLDIVKLVGAVKEEFNFKFPDEIVESISTFQETVDHITKIKKK